MVMIYAISIGTAITLIVEYCLLVMIWEKNGYQKDTDDCRKKL